MLDARISDSVVVAGSRFKAVGFRAVAVTVVWYFGFKPTP